MMDEGMQHRDSRVSSLDHRRRPARAAAVAWASSSLAFAPVARHRSPLWMSPDVQLAEGARRRSETRQIPILTAIRRIAAAVRLRRWRARSQRELRELSDHMLRDIGLRRENVGYEFPNPFRYPD
jgi:uncharacterized protein YjiS (DUF1127 family)